MFNKDVIEKLQIFEDKLVKQPPRLKLTADLCNKADFRRDFSKVIDTDFQKILSLQLCVAAQKESHENLSQSESPVFGLFHCVGR